MEFILVGGLTLHLTLKTITAQVVRTSVTNNSLSKDYPHPRSRHNWGTNVIKSNCLYIVIEVTRFTIAFKVVVVVVVVVVVIIFVCFQHKRADASQIFHDTAGWKHLETSMR